MAHVIRELVRNSIDARSKHIYISAHLKQYKVRVEDDGEGITYYDMLLIGERCATSKTATDTYGFKGEGRVEIESLHQSSLKASKKVLMNGEVISISPATRSTVGTVVQASDLFHNLPVRRMSLVSEEESIHIIGELRAIALLNPLVEFQVSLDIGGKLWWKSASFPTRFGQIYSPGFTEDAFQLSYDDKAVRVKGFVSRIQGHTKISLLFVNKKDMSKSEMNDRLTQLLRNALCEGRKQPVYFISVETVNSELSDRELKHIEMRVMKAIVAGKIPLETEVVKTQPSTTSSQFTAGLMATRRSTALSIRNSAVKKIDKSRPMTASSEYIPKRARISCFHDPTNRQLPRALKQMQKLNESALLVPASISKEDIKSIEPMAQVNNKFILCRVFQKGKQLIAALDQHAADERCLLERLWLDSVRGAGNYALRSKQLPEAVELNIAVDLTLAHHLSGYLKLWAIELLFENESLFVTRIPEIIANRVESGHRDQIEETIELLLQEDSRKAIPSSLDILSNKIKQANAGDKKAAFQLYSLCPTPLFQLFQSAACRNAIMFGDALNTNEISHLITRLSQCEFPFICAHGRPSIVPLVATNFT